MKCRWEVESEFENIKQESRINQSLLKGVGKRKWAEVFFKGVRMGKQNLLFSGSYIMDNTTVAPLCRAQRRRGGAEGEEDERGKEEKRRGEAIHL